MDAVHAEGGSIRVPSWHTGRISHSPMQPGGAPPVASPPCPRPAATSNVEARPVPFETPRAPRLDEAPGIVERFRAAA